MSHFLVSVVSKTGSEQEVERLLAPYQENNMCDCPKEYLKFFEDEDCELDEETGIKGYWENPNAKWDYFLIGGRWKNMIKTKDGNKVNTQKINNIDLSIDRTVYSEYIRYWEVIVEEQELLPEESMTDFLSFFTKDYYIEQYKTKENYATQQASFNSFATAEPNGDWIEKGKMGFWGVNSATKEKRENYIDNFNKLLEKYSDYYLTIVDCHI